jgi:DNA-binding transcriptional LysR family regulator
MAAALVPRLVAGELPDEVVALPAAHLFPSRRVGLVTHAHRPPSAAVDRFIEAAIRLSQVDEPIPLRRSA